MTFLPPVPVIGKGLAASHPCTDTGTQTRTGVAYPIIFCVTLPFTDTGSDMDENEWCSSYCIHPLYLNCFIEAMHNNLPSMAIAKSAMHIS